MLTEVGFGWVVGIFVAAAVAIGLAGWKLSQLADQLADRTGLGEAVAGALFLGATTSLSGTVTTVTAASAGLSDLAISNAIGGIAVQTAFLAIADMFHRKANLEHAAASAGNLLTASLLVVMLSIPLTAVFLPPVTFWGVHPVSLILPIVYLSSIAMLRRARIAPMWVPKRTATTRTDVPDEASATMSLRRLAGEFAVLAVAVGVAGWVIAEAGAELTVRTGLPESAVGGVFTAASTSLPELVTTIAAVRRGALTLAVSGIIGGNAFDVIFLSAADIAYRPGSIYHAFTSTHVLLIAVSLLMTGILMMGLVFRQERGFARIGFESLLILLLYAGLVAFLFLG